MNECMIARIERKYLENILSQLHFARHKSHVGSSPPPSGVFYSLYYSTKTSFCISLLLLIEGQAGEVETC